MKCLITKEQTQVLGNLEYWSSVPISGTDTNYSPKCTAVLAENIPIWKAKWLTHEYKSKGKHSGLFRWRFNETKYRNL